MDLGEDLISLVCLVLNAMALVRCGKSENLDAMNGGWLGVFIAPTTKLAVWWSCLFDDAPDSPVHTGRSGATPDCSVNYSRTAPRIPEGEQFGVWFPGAPDTVRCARPGHTSVIPLIFC